MRNGRWAVGRGWVRVVCCVLAAWALALGLSPVFGVIKGPWEAAGDPQAMQEAEGELQFDMRFDGISFIYPSFYDEEHFPAMIQYRAKGLVEKVLVEVFRPGGVKVWEEDFPPPPSYDWQNSGFAGRTNMGTDADTQPNQVGVLWKFLDPGSSGSGTFTAKLTITVIGGGTLEVSQPFQARARIVAIVNQAKEPTNQDNWGFGPYGKAWIWMTYGLTVDGPAECVNPAENQDKLLLDYQQKDFAFAYTCTTP